LNKKITPYKEILEGQRMWLFEISLMGGRVDISDKDRFELLRKEIKAFYEKLVEQVGNEEKFIHPVLSERVPSSPRAIGAEHKVIHKDLGDLLASLDAIGKLKHQSYQQNGINSSYDS
jgi:putative transposon-encoded protein